MQAIIKLRSSHPNELSCSVIFPAIEPFIAFISFMQTLMAFMSHSDVVIGLYDSLVRRAIGVLRKKEVIIRLGKRYRVKNMRVCCLTSAV